MVQTTCPKWLLEKDYNFIVRVVFGRIEGWGKSATIIFLRKLVNHDIFLCNGFCRHGCLFVVR